MTESLSLAAKATLDTQDLIGGAFRGAVALDKLTTSAKGASGSLAALQTTSQTVGLSSAKNAAIITKEAQSTIALAKARAKAKQDTMFAENYQGNVDFSQKLADQQNAYEGYARNIIAADRNITAQRRTSGEAQAKYAQKASDQGILYGERLTGSMASNVYALYSVAAAWGTVSVATLASVAAVETVGVKYEAEFAHVQRTTEATGSELQSLRSDLIGLTTAIPVDWADTTGIATLGGQLGIASSEIVGFTENVAQFSATTDATVDATATGFGRIAQLTDAGADSFDNIGSAIYKVGINSVATESQILKISQEIATAGNLAGFSTAEIIGLSGALASLGVQPERARGNILRIFSELNEAVGEGGDKLQGFANIAGQSAQDFATSWQNTPEAAFRSLLTGLAGAAQNGEHLDQVIKSLGISAVRDIQTLQQLANNTDVYARAQADASEAYESGTALAEGYGIVAENASARLKVLANTILAIADAGANLGVVKGAIGLLTDMAKTILNLVSTPVGGFVSSVTLGFALILGVFAAARASGLLLTALVERLIQVNAGLAASTGTVAAGYTGLIRQLLTLSGVTNQAAAAQSRYNVALTAGGGKVQAMGAYAGITKSAVTGLSASLATFAKSTGVLALAAGGFWALNQGVESISYAMSSGEEKATAYFGTLSGLTDAIKSDTDAFLAGGTALSVFTTSTTEGKDATVSWASDMDTARAAQDALAGSTGSTTSAVATQTSAIGANAEAWIRKTFLEDTALQKFVMSNKAALDAAGFDIDAFIAAITAGDGGGQKYLSGLRDGVEATRLAAAAAVNDADPFSTAIQEIEGEATRAGAALGGLEKVTSAADGAFTAAAESTQWAEILGLTGDAADDAADSQDGLGTSIDSVNSKLQTQVDALFASQNALAGQQDALSNLGSSLAQNGTSFDVYTANGRANMEALQAVIAAAVKTSAGDAAALASNLAGIAQSVSGFGVNLTAAVPQLASLIGAVPKSALMGVGAAADSAGISLKQGYATGAAKAAKASKSAAKEIKTLTDYVSDLSSVFKTAFDARFGLEEATDDATSAYDKLVEHSEDAVDRVTTAFESLDKASQKVRDLNQELIDLDATTQGLKADKTILEYQLGVATEYKDSLRSEQILAELAKVNADLSSAENDRTTTLGELSGANKSYAEATAELAAAQEGLARTLEGNSTNAREQRAAVLALVSSYQAQIAALANTGATQDQLKAKTAELQRQFESQLAQLGYNRAEIGRYSAAFSDMAIIIDRIPRNITISANLDPAVRAINEFLANNTNGHGASQNIQGTVSYAVDDAAIKRAARAQALLANIVNAQAQLAQYGSNPSASVAISRQIDVWKNLLNSGNYYSGGFTGQGGKYEPAGVVHKGEFVVPKQMVNQSTGLPYANAFGQIMQGYAGGGFVQAAPRLSMPSTMIVELAPLDRALLAAAGNVTVTLDGRVLAQAVNGNNSNNARRGSR